MPVNHLSFDYGFFEAQELAHRKTKWLVVLFVLAVLAITFAIYALAVVVVTATSKNAGNIGAIATDWRLIAGVVTGVFLVIFIGTATKMLELRSGGSAIAAMLGGRRVVGNARRLTDRRVANIVEEMALASGTPVPPVYILDDEESINAFAAGYTVDDAVIGINRGTAEELSREELQGVIAHEFSHILNGDMRMSLRMVGILNGILLISIIGAQVMNVMRFSGHSYRSSSSSNDNNNGGRVALLLIGLGLYTVGSIGLFFGRWIKSTISRQREYLADASAVQFTRIPDGIAGALKMIGGTKEQSFIRSPNAEQISHMFFGSAQMHFLFATHPPLLDRIQRIDNRFDGDFRRFISEREKKRIRRKQAESEEPKQDKKRAFDFLPGTDQFDVLDKMRFPLNPLILIAGIGVPTTEDVEFSELLVDEIPPKLLHAVRETFSARCVVFASLLDTSESIRNEQLKIISDVEPSGSLEATIQVDQLLKTLPQHLRLALFEIIQGTLSAMSPSQYPAFRQTVNALIVADQRIDLFEFFLYHHLIVHLDRCFHAPPRTQNKYKKLTQLHAEIGHMISVLACVGQDDEVAQRTVFNAALSSLYPQSPSFDHLFIANWDHQKLADAFKKVALATPAIKKQVLSAAIVAISHDNVLTIQEVELFRAMSESLDCPVPPLVATRSTPPSEPTETPHH